MFNDLDDHDAICAAQSKELINNGFMEEEFACYGTVYREGGRTKYYISSTENSMHKFITECILRNIYPAPAEYFVMRCNVPAGMKNEIRQQFKKQTAYQLQTQYPLVYSQAVEVLSTYPNDDEAMAILSRAKDELENGFDREGLEIFRGLVLDALVAKHLTKAGYDHWMNWLVGEYRKMDEDILACDYYQRTYTGFGIKNDEQIKYSFNAFEMLTIEKRNRAIAEGKAVTPILKKQYFAATFMGLNNCLEDYKGLMSRYLNKGLFQIIDALHNLPPKVPKAEYQEWLERVEATGKAKAITAFKYHGYRWYDL